MPINTTRAPECALTTRFDQKAVVVLFIVSRIVLRCIGIQFDQTPLDWFYQFLDPMLLKHNLVESIVYLHSQPPGFNLFLGCVLALGKSHAYTMFSLLYMVMGLIMILLLFKVLRYMDIPRKFALGATIFFMLSPPVILYENWLFYTYPVAMLLLVSAFLLYTYLKHQRTSTLIIFFSCCAAIVLTRTLFHTFWFIAILGWLLYLRRQRVKQILLCALIPLVILAGLHIKNFMLFRQTGYSSWFGMNIAKMTLTVPLHTLQAEYENGKVSRLAQIEPFGAPEEYYPFAHFDTTTHVPVLDMEYKSTGYPNYNHIAYISVSQQYLTTAHYLISKYPLYYLLSIVKALYAYFQPSSDEAIFVNNNRLRIKIWTLLYEDYILGGALRFLWQATFTNRYSQERIIHLNFLFFFTPFIIIWGWINQWKKKNVQGDARNSLFMFIISTITYVTVIGNALEMSENMRFRFLIVPFFYILFCLFFKQLFNKKSIT